MTNSIPLAVLASLLVLCALDAPGAHAAPPQELFRALRGEKAYQHGVKKYVPLDIEKLSLEIGVDRPNRLAKTVATVDFELKEEGYPSFYFIPLVAEAALLGGATADPIKLGMLVDETGTEITRTVERKLQAGKHSLRITYVMPDFEWVAGGGFQFHPTMTDLTARRYLEKFLPSSTLGDQFPTELLLRLKGVSSEPVVRANGVVATQAGAQPGEREIRVSFPAYFNSTMHYLFVSTKPITEVTELYDNRIPITLFSQEPNASALLAKAMPIALSSFQAFEAHYGAYAHPAFVGKINAGTGGMEYGGATDSSISALAHEIHHSWFARGVIAGPDGGWIDEALASWNDQGRIKTREASFGTERYTLAGISPDFRLTESQAYAYGAQIIGVLHELFGTPAFAQVLRELYQAYFLKPISTKQFEAFVLARAPASIAPTIQSIFNEYVYGADCRVFRESRSVPLRDVYFAAPGASFLVQPERNDVGCFGDPAQIATMPLPGGAGGFSYVAPLAGNEDIHYGLQDSQIQGHVRVITQPALAGVQIAKDKLAPGSFLLTSYAIPEAGISSVDELLGLAPLATSVVGPSISFEVKEGEVPGTGLTESVGLRYEGYFAVALPGFHQFQLNSDDGSKLYVDGIEVIANDGGHKAVERTGIIHLAAGLHSIDLRYMELSGPATLKLKYRRFGSVVGPDDLGIEGTLGFQELVAGEVFAPKN